MKSLADNREYLMEYINKIIHGDCLEKLKELPDNSVDSIVTDPPYELGFMGKSWDNTGIANNKEMWAECLRVLKPGGYLLSFGGTRTYHRMACAIEDAGFEVRDMIEWVYGSGFPKSLNVGVAVNKLETKEWSAIGKALDNIDQKSIIEVWKSNSNNVKIADKQSLKQSIEAGGNTPSESFVQENVVENTNQIKLSLNVNTAEKHFIALQAIHTEESTVLQNAEKIITEISELQNLATTAENSQPSDHAMQSMSIFTAQCDVKEWLNENTEVSHKVDEALKTLRGNKKYSNEEITNVLCAVIPSVLKHTILNQSKTFQNLDTNQKMECVSAINVIITEYIMENLISNTVAILKSKAVDKLQGNERELIEEKYRGENAGKQSGIMGKTVPRIDKISKGTSEWEGWGTALKPAHEPICMARKPLAEKTVAENCLKWGTGGINIDESRVGTEERYNAPAGNKAGGNSLNMSAVGMPQDVDGTTAIGRFPANLLHDNSEEVRECFPETKGGGSQRGSRKWKGEEGDGGFGGWAGKVSTDHYVSRDDGTGNASRFFKSILYYPKASKSERNKGCEELEEKPKVFNGQSDKPITDMKDVEKRFTTLPKANNHPTVKPLALCEYLIKMITPKGGIVLDPFAGSGSTLVAAKQNGFNYVGIEMTEEYLPIINARLGL